MASPGVVRGSFSVTGPSVRSRLPMTRESSTNPCVRAGRREILAGKRLLLMREMLPELGYRDVTLVDDLINGFSLVGQTPDAAALPSTSQPAFLSKEDLLYECETPT